MSILNQVTFFVSTKMTDLQVAPAPWNLKGRSWVFPVSPLSTMSSFPAGWSAPYQAETLASGGNFIGGLGLVQLVSYSDSPVESTMNGRKNWNIPKHFANFNITSASDGTIDISVSHPGASTPFFKASVKSIPVVSSLSIPSSTSILGKFFMLMQPPLPAGAAPEDVATDQWAALTPIIKGSTSLRTMTPGLEGKVGDGAGFPAVAPWPIAFFMENLNMEFGIAVMHDTV
ncbi:hypothetical protein DFH09DRAFT_1135078 [Mycena vulgaris]|nr:hypothetical protein DFH09DRAFT_1135078 [Mycena vulgaris]